ncbi:copper chaperone PCu(A)C [Thalassotalea sp. LPB0316]|uniref:copper chaperone PCu(A)C n=1 Tax=Thalassotalea sp. LPB0316 TaxID=2769490 RepID=UPI0018676AF1|nr:copper chaperone PCu(A)C [Thalassotalea sp. LPB0316]QOL25922.1 copper chaperone PCu(A)C [Thalassotalea sp. LPB0316]
MNKVMTFIMPIALCLLLAPFAKAIAGEVEVSGQYMRELIPGTNVTSSYMRITNHHAVEIILVAAKASFSPRIELHEHTMVNGMMRMGQVDKIIIPAHQTVTLEPAGLHIMAFDIQQSLKHGQSESLTLLFEEHPPIVVDLPIKSIKHVNTHQHH